MLNEILSAVSAKLTASGTPGSFSETPHDEVSMVVWHGGRRHLGEAERALVTALETAGFRAERCLGVGVRVLTDETRAFGDVECLHNEEPSEEALAAE